MRRAVMRCMVENENSCQCRFVELSQTLAGEGEAGCVMKTQTVCLVVKGGWLEMK